MAIWLALLKSYFGIRAGESPIHREGVRRPIRLDDLAQRRDGVFRPVDRSGHKEVEAWIGAEQARDVEGQDTMPEVTHSRRLGTEIRLDPNGFLVIEPVPPR